MDGERRAPPAVLRWVVQVGFLVVFAVVALVFGLWFGVNLMETQRAGIESINRIQDVETIQVRQLAQINERLERVERAVGSGP